MIPALAPMPMDRAASNLSFSSQDGSQSETDQLTIIESLRNDNPRKRRRLNDHRAQASGHREDQNSTTSNEDSVEGDDVKSNASNKENDSNLSQLQVGQLGLQNGNKNRKRRRPSATQIIPSPSKSNRRVQLQSRNNHLSQHNGAQFGGQQFDRTLDCPPGALVRLELINFLCHSGKSAIECAISMVLGCRAKGTGRGENINDVIKFGQSWGRIRLFLHNQGPEALEGYGHEIVIERKLSRNSKNGYSAFKVMNFALQSKGTGLKHVKEITDKFNICVNNPCVILQQSTAKKFLNSTKSSDKFAFFMKASKLADYQNTYEEAQKDVYLAREQQKNSKGSFAVIKQQFNECKQQYDMLLQYQEQLHTITVWNRAAKWMEYKQHLPFLAKCTERVEITVQKIQSSKQQQQGVATKIKKEIERATALKDQIENRTNEILGRFQTPINQLKTKQRELDKERGRAARAASSKQKFVDRSRQKIAKFQREYQAVVQQLENDERGQALASLTAKINESSNKLVSCRQQLETSLSQTESSQEMEIRERELQSLKATVTQKQNEKKNIERQLNHMQSNSDRMEWFNAPAMQRRGVRVRDILNLLQQHRHEFTVPPIGPLGAHIQMVNDGTFSQQDLSRNISIVQSVMGSSMFSFLVHDSRDQQTFRRLMKRRFREAPPCIQYRSQNRMIQITENPFVNQQIPPEHGPIVRVADMYSIKDNNPWIYNALIVNSNPERMFAHGTVTQARRFMSNLDNHTLRYVAVLYTYRENGKLFGVKRRGGSVSGSPVRIGKPLLQADMSQMRQYLQNQMDAIRHALNGMKSQIRDLTAEVQREQALLTTARKNKRKLEQNISTLERKIGSYQREKTQIEEDQEDDSEAQRQLEDFQNKIEDEKSQMNQIQEEIQPFVEKENQLLEALSRNKIELHKIEQAMEAEKNDLEHQKDEYQRILSGIKVTQAKMLKIPQFIAKLEAKLEKEEDAKSKLEEKIETLHQTASESGEEITEIPTNPSNRNRPFQDVTELRKETKRLRQRCEEWTKHAKDADKIRRDYELIVPKFRDHQERMDNCNHNVDEMQKMMKSKLKDFEWMKSACKDRLEMEFRLIMRKQGHDGHLKVNYENGSLDMVVKMASHGGETQVANSKTLSGGERSFTQVAMIMALQTFSGSPFCIYDEFDVFMDSVNRGNSIKILLKAALGNDSKPSERQYLFITPNDVSPVIAAGKRDLIKIHQLRPPRKGRQQ